MKTLLSLIFVLIRFFVIYKVIKLLYVNFETTKNLNDLIWWSTFLVFDLWLQYTTNNLPTNKDSE